MTAPISEIVKVNITRDSVNISRVGFGTVLILGGNANFASRVAYFTDLASVEDALLSGNAAPEYAAAAAAFAQNPKVEQIAIGHRVATVTATDNAGTFTAGSISATVNGVLKTQSWTTDKDTTLTALCVKIAAVTGIASAVYSSGSHTITITPTAGNPVGLSFDLASATGTLSYVFTTSETEDADTALSACAQETNNWYGVVLTDRTESQVLKAAAWVAATELKMFFTASDDAEIVDSTLSGDTGSIAKVFAGLGYLKAAIIYSTKAATEYADAALFGRILPLDPGSYDAYCKSLVGVSVDNLTPTQRANAFEKNANVYEYAGGVNILRMGNVSGNETIDTMIFIDWLQARATEAIFAVIVSSLKVPYTDAGIHALADALEQPLKTGQNAGGISPLAYDDAKKQIGGYYIVSPRLQDVPTVDKAGRVLRNLKFTAFLAGAIRKVYVDGVVTV